MEIKNSEAKPIFIIGRNDAGAHISFYPENADQTKTIDSNIYYLAMGFDFLRQFILKEFSERGLSANEEQITAHLLSHFHREIGEIEMISFPEISAFKNDEE